ncbi:MAG TPA: hypothetical protein VK669_12955, partial [Candidatus Limnocylindrales bacterium]|nr:hypothetical protein [Candidatus Limnocylindrales bacterium]
MDRSVADPVIVTSLRCVGRSTTYEFAARGWASRAIEAVSTQTDGRAVSAAMTMSTTTARATTPAATFPMIDTQRTDMAVLPLFGQIPRLAFKGVRTE